MRTYGSILGVALCGLWMVGCSKISDCGHDAQACASMLVEAKAACAETFKRRISDRERKICERAIRVVGKKQAVSARPGLEAILAAPDTNVAGDDHRRLAAKALGELGDPQAVDALLAALDLTERTGSSAKHKAIQRANEAIATALGRLKDRRATAKLLEVLKRSTDDYVVLKAVRALGTLRDPTSVASLAQIALSHENKFMRKNAVIALGDIGSAEGADALIQALFIEYRGVSYYQDASFALFQIGPKVVDALLETMRGNNAQVNAYFARTKGLRDTAIKTKCAVVLSDLGDRRAVPLLLAAFQTGIKTRDQLLVAYVADALGALGAKEAVPVLVQEMTSLDPSRRRPIMRALNRIGDRAPVPEMIDAMTRTHFVTKCVKDGVAGKDACASDELVSAQAREVAADFASMLASQEHLESFKTVAQAEKNPKLRTHFETRLKLVALAAECKTGPECWAKKLEDPDPLLREKAAWELSRASSPSAIPALRRALGDKKPAVRFAAIVAYRRSGDKSAIPDIEKRLVDEESRADFLKVNQELKRLLVFLRRTQTPPPGER